ncbi:hypothetical protein ASPFODRAFT_405229 [Aspergillus luchuensis CBS 106.47]|uniref:Uncharacterized protein n=1 Tax=Aspergillus luchuensis (strain CBS 106.47) TaxID=1137211 RepID=A0A1M3T1W2_ASPLC|nr:hypothetical protein ASPFODRAFT_405229 [Aspergillus luchuensis CBS 106.47]
MCRFFPLRSLKGKIFPCTNHLNYEPPSRSWQRSAVAYRSSLREASITDPMPPMTSGIVVAYMEQGILL